MLAAVSSSSSYPLPPKKYDVFISFRGEDTRSNFTSHLHSALCRKNMETYIDYRLHKGDEVLQSILQAIKDSSVSVVVFSENYASSKWCLDELIQILQCRKHQGQVVIPVFYKVDPSEVRNQRGTYKEAFTKHERNFMHNQYKVKEWKDALFEAANLDGWDSRSYGTESEFIEDIVKHILENLDHLYPSESAGHVRIGQIKHDVYISFKGSDIRRGFLSHLKKELHQKQIDTYEDEILEKGDEISSTLLRAIEGSMIFLVIFSKEYASSRWCLEELVKIMECKELNGQIVIPVFYYIDRSAVRHQRGTYGDAFVQHEEKFKVDIETLQIWRSVLNRAANLSGYEYSKFENESELIEAIVKDISKKLDHIYPSESVGLVGIEQHLAHIESLLKMETRAIQIVGIWGMGGVGKTTIAQAAFAKFSFQFECCCFLENVSEESQKYGLSFVRGQILAKLQGEKSTYLKKRLSRKKVLIVLDDVSTLEQLKYLVKAQISLGPYSRVIVTSRDRHVLISGGAHAILEVKGLSIEESLQLFCVNAFKQGHPKMGYEELSKRIVDYAHGSPLALKFLGSFLHSRNIETWESMMTKLMNYPHRKIHNVLKQSYDGLYDVEKEIFLDIAFFYKGEYKDDVIRLLNACGFFASIGICTLLDKGLITISYDHIEMHDLMQEMGWEIVRQDSINDLGRRSRLRDDEEVYEVLKNNKGTEAIEGILLNMSQIGDVHLSADTFKKMTKLRFLKFYSFECTNLHIPTGLESFSDNLRYLQWDEYPLKSLPSSFCPENLVELHLRCSLVEKLWDGVKVLVNLWKVDLWGSKQLKELPDFSNAPNLEWMELSDCISLCHVHPSILTLKRLVSLGLWGCKSLKSLQSETPLKSLEQLDIDGCSSLSEFSLSVKEIIDLWFSHFSFKIVHSSDVHLSKPASLFFNGSTLKIHQVNELHCLKSLEETSLSYWRQVNDKPMLDVKTGDLHSLRELYLDGCSDFCCLSESIACLSLLQVLRLKKCGIKSLPACIKFLKKLVTLDLSDCKRLGSLPELPESIAHLNVNNCTSLESVFIVTSLLHNYSMRFLSLVNCGELCEDGIMEDACLLLHRLPLRGIMSASVCYPGSKVPEWFKNNRRAKASITIELSSNSTDLKGFVCCFVLRKFNSEQKSQIHLNCQWYFEDSEEIQGTIGDNIDLTTELSSDHVFLLYDGFCCHEILKGLFDRRRDDQGTTHGQNLSFEFSVVVNGETAKHDDLIIECGVCPVFISEYHNFLQQKNIRGKIGKEVP